MTAFIALLLSLQTGTAQLVPDLRSAVTRYWDLLSGGDEYQALQYVAEPSRNAFVRRKEPFIQSWRLTGVQPIAADRAFVTVTARSLVQGSFRDLQLTEHWVREADGWKVQIPESSQGLKRLWQTAPEQPRAGELRVLPRALRIHFISPNQSSSIVIENGLDDIVEVVGLDYDATRFRVDGQGPVASGETGRIVVRYIGDETAKNLTSEIRVVTRSDGGERVHSIPITYNLVSEAARALLGLTREAAEKLGRTDTLRPAPTSPVRYERGRSAGQDPRKRPNREQRR